MRRRDGTSRSRAGYAVDAGSILGVSALRPPLLVHVSAAEGETGGGPGLTNVRQGILMTRIELDDDDDDLDEDEDDFDDEDESGDEEDDDDEDEEDDGETWQVA